MKLPREIFGISTEEALKKYLEGSSKKPSEKPKQLIAQTTAVDGVNLHDYIFMPQHKLYVAKEKTLHGKNWYASHEELHNQKSRMLTLREFIDFILLLKSGKVEDGLGDLVSGKDATDIYNEITKVGGNWRSEWIDAKYNPVGNTLNIDYNHRTIKGQLEPQNTEPLEKCLMENCNVDINKFNKQGMPTTKGDDFYYWHPVNGAVAWFDAFSDGAGLGCVRDPRGSFPVLGVRQAREKL